MVAHTAAKPVHKRELLPRTTEVGLDRWLALDAEGWERIHAATSRSVPPPKPRTPRPHQRAAIQAARDHFDRRNNTRGRMIMPCGTGKSLTAFWIAQSLQARSILVAVPSLALIKQSLTDWTREFLAHGEVPDWLCVCSDETTGHFDRDEFVGEVYELGVDATTDPAEIAQFLATKNGRRRIVFATYQSGTVLAKAARKGPLPVRPGDHGRGAPNRGLPGEGFRPPTAGQEHQGQAPTLHDRHGASGPGRGRRSRLDG